MFGFMFNGPKSRRSLLQDRPTTFSNISDLNSISDAYKNGYSSPKTIWCGEGNLNPTMLLASISTPIFCFLD